MHATRTVKFSLDIRGIATEDFHTVKPLNSGHLRVLKICPLLKDVRYWEVIQRRLSHLGLNVLSLFMACPLFRISAIGRFHCNKYMIASTQITNTEISAFIAVLVFKLLSRKVLFVNKKTIETVKKLATFYKNNKFHG